MFQNFSMDKRYTIILPAHNEAPTIGGVLKAALKSSAREIIVVDDDSSDGTAEKAKEVDDCSGRLKIVRHRVNKGYCAARRSGILEARTQSLIFYDCDLRNPRVEHFEKLARPLLENKVDYVIGSFDGQGRVTEYLARPLLEQFLPSLARYKQPLSGLVGIRRRFLFPEKIKKRYANLGILLDAYFSGARFEEVDLGKIIHDKRSDGEKFSQAREECSAFFDALFRSKHRFPRKK